MIVTLGRVVGPATVERRRSAARATAARRGRINREEVIEHIKAGYLQTATNRGGRRPGVNRGEGVAVLRRHRADAPGVSTATARERPVQYTGQVGDCIAAAEEVAVAQAGHGVIVIRVGRIDRAVLAIVGVIQNHRAAG